MPKAKKKSSKKSKRWIWSKRRIAIIASVCAIAVFFAAYAFFAVSNHSDSKTVVEGVSTKSIPKFDHIVIIVEENHGDKSILNSRDASYIRGLVKQYSYASAYYASGHPSLPNYLTMTSGSNWGINRSCPPEEEGCSTNSKNIADLIEASGLSWRAYYEDMPGACWMSSTDLYYTDYNPFVYYTDITQDTDRCAQHDVPLDQLGADLASTQSLPNLVFISPNSCNDMHNCPISTGDKWLAKTATEILDSPAFTKQNSLLIVMWDESEKENSDNNIPLIMAGRSVRKSYVSSTRYGHLDLLKTIEAAWNLPPLNKSDRNAKPMLDMFN